MPEIVEVMRTEGMQLGKGQSVVSSATDDSAQSAPTQWDSLQPLIEIGNPPPGSDPCGGWR